ncbi:unnamed protein product [Didymodactylos carnosus]|uniref:EF-hand domain-containing protein n=1 Tax=Didymodactylos carnosus TaxID=1234261 RepID=A0A815ED38_9BILA|nr:unnamed protein product [Didymodactylos carnosus]CAF1309818.1 unnamed protein product [Didymodactylos carnosus]CAF3670979.1 unnamed protein product [Didymodactylos carnosus]CAF4146103.1 unnamed protein product [Didymodactylos carnosus]
MDRDEKINKQEFQRLYQYASGSNRLTDHVFSTLDCHGSGKLSFEQFLIAIIILSQHAIPYYKIGYIINQNSRENQGKVSRLCGQKILEQLNSYYDVDVNLSDLWSQIDYCELDYVSISQFAQCISYHPVYKQYLCAYTESFGS